jgi:hypothetical protein
MTWITTYPRRRDLLRRSRTIGSEIDAISGRFVIEDFRNAHIP